MKTSPRFAMTSTCLFINLILTACGFQQAEISSQPLVTSVQHSAVKRQYIGNCWLYAHASWLESLILGATGREVDVSEGYWTYWHLYNQLMKRTEPAPIDFGGFWDDAAQIVQEHGYMLEEEFQPSVREEWVLAQRQVFIEAVLNQNLRTGLYDGIYHKLHQEEVDILANEAQRRANWGEQQDEAEKKKRIRQALDRVFDIDMEELEKRATRADDSYVIKRADGQLFPLSAAYGNDKALAWQKTYYPAVRGGDPRKDEEPAMKSRRKAVLQRVMRALNDHQPVVMALMVDFNAIDLNDGTFRLDVLQQKGPGKQGGHMLVLSDYAVENVPGIGSLGKGELSAELKEQALLGDVSALFAKNSWGIDRPERGLTDGYSGFEMRYLNFQNAWKGPNFESDPASVLKYTALLNFVLPPGY